MFCLCVPEHGKQGRSGDRVQPARHGDFEVTAAHPHLRLEVLLLAHVLPDRDWLWCHHPEVHILEHVAGRLALVWWQLVERLELVGQIVKEGKLLQVEAPLADEALHFVWTEEGVLGEGDLGHVVRGHLIDRLDLVLVSVHQKGEQPPLSLDQFVVRGDPPATELMEQASHVVEHLFELGLGQIHEQALDGDQELFLGRIA